MISIHQFTVLVILVTIGDAFLILPATVADVANQDAWISTIVALVFGLLIIYLFITVGNLYPKLSLVQYNIKILGKWIGSLVSLFFFGYLFFTTSLMLRELCNFITKQILTDTPIQIIHFLFIIVIIMGVRAGLETIARTSELFFPVVFISILILFTLVLPKVHLDWVQPILADGVIPPLKGVFIGTAFPFMELVVFLMILPSINNQGKIKKSFFIGTIIGGIVLILIVLLCILVLGESGTSRNLYPTFTLARVINIGGIIQRIEGILTIIWIITVYLKITLYTYALHIGIAQLLKLGGYRILTLPFGMILFASAMLIAPNTSYLNNILANYWPFYDLTVAVLLPLFLISVFAIRKKLNSL